MQANVTGAQYLMLMGGFLLVAFVLIAALVVYQWVLRRTGQLAAASPVSTISAVPTVTPIIELADPELDDDVMSRNRRIVIGSHRLRSTLRTRTENRELARLRTENRKLTRQLSDITEGQVKGIDLFLEAERKGKPLTRTGAALLMGKSKSEALQLIRDREPVPDEIARPEPVPA
jgi:hypothetical protein